MSEIERIQRYIDKTGAEKGVKDLYSMTQLDMRALLDKAGIHTAPVFDAIWLAFDYGKAKGYRAAKAEARRA